MKLNDYLARRPVRFGCALFIALSVLGLLATPWVDEFAQQPWWIPLIALFLSFIGIGGQAWPRCASTWASVGLILAVGVGLVSVALVGVTGDGVWLFKLYRVELGLWLAFFATLFGVSAYGWTRVLQGKIPALTEAGENQINRKKACRKLGLGLFAGAAVVFVVWFGLSSWLTWRFGQMNQQLEQDHWRRQCRTAYRQLAKAGNDHDRFYPITQLARSCFYLGLTNKARAYAQEQLSTAPQFTNDWNYGNAIHDGHLVLGRLAVRQGRIDDAKRYLIAAGHTPGSPQLDNSGPDLGLAQDLLLRGERETVIEYLGLCAKFWRNHGSLLDQWRRDIRAGKRPNLEEGRR